MVILTHNNIVNHSFNIFKFAQEQLQLEQIYNVAPEFSYRVEQLVKEVPKTQKGLKRHLIKQLKENPVQNEQQLIVLENDIRSQIQSGNSTVLTEQQYVFLKSFPNLEIRVRKSIDIYYTL
jgi:hypothetical protein